MNIVEAPLRRLGDTPIFLSNYLCTYEFAGWRKNHRRSRINKKWHKKYGSIRKCPGKAVQVAGLGLACCPHIYEQLKKECGE